MTDGAVPAEVPDPVAVYVAGAFAKGVITVDTFVARCAAAGMVPGLRSVICEALKAEEVEMRRRAAEGERTMDEPEEEPRRYRMTLPSMETYCTRCGAIVADKAAHDVFHDNLESTGLLA